jgi:YD repeat-containing protein
MTFQLSSAQYYYKDILSSEQTSAQLKKYKNQRVRLVTVTSFENNGQPTEDFTGSQTIADNFSSIRTVFNTAMAGESELTTFFNAEGRIVKTVDTTDGSGSISEYRYNASGKLASIINISTSPGMHQEKEEHRWQYDAQGRPQTMLRIKNNIDTTVISFVLDEKGNVAEENSRRGGTAQSSYYYYYDEQNRVTDIVTYNQKARRLLPIYVFEYNTEGQISSMLVVPEGTDEYQRWVYQYNEAGLKTKETAFNKRKQMLGRIEYAYDK